MKRKIFTITHGTYPYDVLVAIGATDDEVRRTLEKKLRRALDSDERERIQMPGSGRTCTLKEGVTLLRVRADANKARFAGLIAHEVFHCVEFLFDTVGQKHDVQYGEAWAYQIQHLMQQIYARIDAQ